MFSNNSRSNILGLIAFNHDQIYTDTWF